MRLTRICLENLKDLAPRASLAAEKIKALHEKSFDIADITKLLGRYQSLSTSSRIALSRRYDKFYLLGAYRRFKTKLLSQDQYFNTARQSELGPDLYASHFVVSRGGRVTFSTNKDTWIDKLRNLPRDSSVEENLVAIDAKACNILPSGLENFYELNHLQYFNLSKNIYLDDISCDYLSRLFRNSKSLEFIDLSDNPQITINGLQTLFRIRSLKVIKCTLEEHLELFKMLAKDECNCDIITD